MPSLVRGQKHAGVRREMAPLFSSLFRLANKSFSVLPHAVIQCLFLLSSTLDQPPIWLSHLRTRFALTAPSRKHKSVFFVLQKFTTIHTRVKQRTESDVCKEPTNGIPREYLTHTSLWRSKTPPESSEGDSEEGDGRRKWAVVHHREGIRRYGDVPSVHGQLDRLGGYFPTTAEWGLFVCCAVCTSVLALFGSVIPSHFPFFPWGFLVLALEHENILPCACPLGERVRCHPIFFSSRKR